jgi:hypothetical protein
MALATVPRPRVRPRARPQPRSAAPSLFPDAAPPRRAGLGDDVGGEQRRSDKFLTGGARPYCQRLNMTVLGELG